MWFWTTLVFLGKSSSALDAPGYRIVLEPALLLQRRMGKDEQSSLGVGEGRRGDYPSRMRELKKKEYLQIMCNHTNLLLRDSSSGATTWETSISLFRVLMSNVVPSPCTPIGIRFLSSSRNPDRYRPAKVVAWDDDATLYCYRVEVTMLTYGGCRDLRCSGFSTHRGSSHGLLASHHQFSQVIGLFVHCWLYICSIQGFVSV